MSIGRNKIYSQNKSQEKSYFNRYMKLLRSFDSQHQLKINRVLTQASQQKEDQSNRKLVGSAKKISQTSDVSALLKKRKNSEVKPKQVFEQTAKRSKSTNFQDVRIASKIKLPFINNKDYNDRKRHSFSFNAGNYKTKTQPIEQKQANYPKILFKKVQGVRSGNLLQFSKLKPTEKYFFKMQNIKLAQKLLLVQPSKNLRKSQHKKFYQQQKTYRSKISYSILLRKNNQNKKCRYCKISKQQWID